MKTAVPTPPFLQKTLKGGLSRTKGGVQTAPTNITVSNNHQENHAHTREASLAEKENEQAEPEPEPEPPPFRAAPPAFNDFARDYRKQHDGIRTRYSEIYRAYQDYCEALEAEEAEA